ncbi:sialidase family protein [Fulvivirgaceae bacterium BMA12]|uniref:exo-alpha-sialidase n=2 Tax=Agaribacillus aureus TaxID=3051825 RepID=A0ABT8LGF6_9BACT|nr:sialidase family protein [Fulvivirgaceae bacterium BMA12]
MHLNVMKPCLIFLLLIFNTSYASSISLHEDTEVFNVETGSRKLKWLFKSGDHGYACYRIPALVVANDGSVLAFCEARKESCSDTNDIDLVMKKSTDNGKTWGDMQVIWSDDANVCGNPSPVVDRVTGDIHLLATWNNGKDHESQIIAGTSIAGREVYHLVSGDAGETWSSPVNISGAVKLPDWTWYATGPVHGIQLKNKAYKNRLVIPCDHIERDSKKYYSHVIYSDDHGKTWQLGGTTPTDQVNECTVAELSNGDLMLNMRNYQRKDAQVRQVAISRDGGASWVEQQMEPQLPEPRCQGAMLAIAYKGRNLLLFTNPAHEKSRINMTLSVSEDDGATWHKKIVIYDSHSAYSDLAALAKDKILVLYEAGYEGPYEGISYKILSKKEL